MRNNRKQDMNPFDMSKKPVRQYPFLLPLIWGASYILTRRFGLKISRLHMKDVKPPFLVISTHQGFSDYYIAPLALFPHRANYVSDMEGFAAFGEWLYRGIGCIGKRRYVSDYAVVKNIKRALNIGQSVVVYPESRHSNVGTTAYLPKNLGKLAKLMNVPVVLLSAHGSYLANPFWDEEHTRKTKMEATLECIYTKEQLNEITEQEIQNKIEEKLQYDEYKWQLEMKNRIMDPNRVRGLHKVLYQCKKCKTEFQMQSEGNKLYCNACHAVWMQNDLGQLVSEEGTTGHIPDWYEWERTEVERQIDTDTYRGDFSVQVEALPNAKGFVPLGKGTLTQGEKGFTLNLSNTPNKLNMLNMPKQTFFFDYQSRESVQTEYNYRGKGECIVLSDKNCCYYIYSDDPEFNPTKIQFSGEYAFKASIPRP